VLGQPRCCGTEAAAHNQLAQRAHCKCQESRRAAFLQLSSCSKRANTRRRTHMNIAYRSVCRDIVTTRAVTAARQTHTGACSSLTQDNSDRDSTNSNYMQPPPAEYGAQKCRQGSKELKIHRIRRRRMAVKWYLAYLHTATREQQYTYPHHHRTPHVPQPVIIARFDITTAV
jgi:hypothetical protein